MNVLIWHAKTIPQSCFSVFSGRIWSEFKLKPAHASTLNYFRTSFIVFAFTHDLHWTCPTETASQVGSNWLTWIMGRRLYTHVINSSQLQHTWSCKVKVVGLLDARYSQYGGCWGIAWLQLGDMVSVLVAQFSLLSPNYLSQITKCNAGGLGWWCTILLYKHNSD